MTAKRFVWIAALPLVVLPPVAVGQDRPMFSSASDLVVLHATVRDRRGAYISGLPREAFAVVEDGRPQNVQLFTSEDAPVTVGLLIDSSGSMQPSRDRVIAAAAAFAEASHPSDELFALGFNDTVAPALPAAAPFTGDPEVLRQALTQTIHTQGRTALFDALAAGLDYLALARHERKVLVVVSDGRDNASRATFDEIMTRTQASNVVIYTVALVDPIEGPANSRILQRIARASGGEPFAPRHAGEIEDVLGRIARDIRHTYTLGYVSTNGARDGAFRQIRLDVQSPDRRRFVVRTRGGYLAALPRARSEADVRSGAGVQ